MAGLYEDRYVKYKISHAFGRGIVSGCLKIGIMGGTFDPVHNAHLFIAETVREAFSLDKVLFIPVGDPPHKKVNRLAPGEDRVNMLREAVRSNPWFQVDDMEIKRQGITYTIDTLKELKARYPGYDLCYIIGGDTLLDLKNWRDFMNVARLCSFIVYRRPGYEDQEINSEADRLAREYQADIAFVEGPGLDISSRYIKSRLYSNQTIRYLVPEAVYEYIKKRKLYKGV